MNKLNKYNYYLSIALKAMFGIDIFYRYKGNLLPLLIYMSLYLIVLLNEYFRWKVFYKNIRMFYASFIVSMVIIFGLSTRIGSYLDIYLFIILYELVIFTQGRISNYLIITVIGFMTMPLFVKIIAEVRHVNIMEFAQENFIDIMMSFMVWFFYLLSLFTLRALRREKRKVEELNKEIQQLTISEERNRVASEIHDNLGHNLVTLSMNLDVAEKIMYKDEVKAMELVQKSRILTKESIDNLRKAVYSLKGNRSEELINSIEKIIHDIESSGQVKIVSNMDKEIEEISSEYKDTIIIIIKECLTNSIKHGKADMIHIDISTDKDNIYLNIRDNGKGCNNIVKGNGLLGIEKRVRKHQGQVAYNNKEGFKVELILPF